MNFEDFIQKGHVRRSTPDKALAKSLISAAEQDLKFLKTLKLDDYSARKIMTNYYDVLRSILEAITSLEGYKVYSHEAFTYFLKDKREDLLAEKFDRFRKIRNKINYYGKSISAGEVKEHISQIIQLIEGLKSKYLNKIWFY